MLEVTFTLFFEGPFWVGYVERNNNGLYQVARVVFGSEPTDAEIYDFILRRYHTLRFSEGFEDCAQNRRYVNPKRARREAAKLLSRSGASTKAQLAVQEQYLQRKGLQKAATKERKKLRQQEKFAQKQEKRKKKKRGH